MSGYAIGEVSRRLDLPVDTLRYYEKIGLLQPVARTPGGMRRYSKTDLDRLRFIRRAQGMDFSLMEIAQLLELRDAPASARGSVRALTRSKLKALDKRLADLRHLREELAGLLSTCENEGGEGCPILEGIQRDPRD